jgi:hypothetical protein
MKKHYHWRFGSHHSAVRAVEVETSTNNEGEARTKAMTQIWGGPVPTRYNPQAWFHNVGGGLELQQTWVEIA